MSGERDRRIEQMEVSIRSCKDMCEGFGAYVWVLSRIETLADTDLLDDEALGATVREVLAAFHKATS